MQDGSTVPSFERRVVTYRSHGDPDKDREMFVQYRSAYGHYANIRQDDLEHIPLPMKSLPDWAIVCIHIEPDYSINIGAVDRVNDIKQYFLVRGRTVEFGFSIAAPKVLFDSRTDDPIVYGNTSAVLRMYLISSESGNRFPVSVGIGIFEVNSPVDVGIGRGGFALVMLLDMAEVARIVEPSFTQKVNFGLETDPFLSIGRIGRLLFSAQAGYSF